MSLSGDMVRALTWVEQVYWEEGQIPSNEAVAAATSLRVETVRSYWEHEDFRIAAAARGIDGTNALDPNPRALTMEQLLVANVLMNIHDRRSLREKLKDPALAALNISPQRVQAWMRQPAFQQHLQKRADEAFKDAKPLAYRELIRLIEAGDLKAITLYFEMAGIYNPRMQVDVNITVVIARVVEIVTKHVRDPAILAAIAADVEALELGAAGAIAASTSAPNALKALDL